MNMVNWIENILASPVKKAMPILSFPSVQLMNITVKDLLKSSELQAGGMALIAQRVPSAASVSMMDLSVEAEAFGSQIMLSDNEVPTVVGRIVNSLEDAQALKVPKVQDGRTHLYVQAIQSACKQINDRPVFAGVIGAFSLAGRLMDVSEAMINCYENPKMVHTTLAKATQFITEYIKCYKAVGANGVIIAEPLAGILSPGLVDEFSSQYIKKIVDQVQDENFIVIYHNCGTNTVQMLDSLFAIGAKGYHFGNAVDIESIFKIAPSDLAVFGNIDPASQFRNGTPESITKATLNLLNRCGKYSNFIISSGCDIPPASKWENIDAFFSAVNTFYRQ